MPKFQKTLDIVFFLFTFDLTLLLKGVFMFCSKCGAQLPDDAKFCDKCGAALHSNAAPVMPKVNPFAEPGQTPVYMQDETSSKSKFTAFILALFFGWIGLHNFYMGHTLRGLMQLALQVVCLVTLILGIGLLIEIPFCGSLSK